MAKTVIHKAGTRGHAEHGWLESYHSFSFADYYNPDRINFGALRVLNDDCVAAGKGFGTHPHDNMEIISIPLSGDLEHRDSMGNVTVIKSGDIQVMSAGTGIQHSEYNKNPDQEVRFLQIWIIPDQKNVSPRYGQIALNREDHYNKLQQIVSPDPNNEGVWIHQNAWLHLGRFDQEFKTTYSIKYQGNGVYVFVLEGNFSLEGFSLNRRDSLGIWDTETISIKADSPDAEILLIEVPMII